MHICHPGALLLWVAEGGLFSQEYVESCPEHPVNHKLSLPLYYEGVVTAAGHRYSWNDKGQMLIEVMVD